MKVERINEAEEANVAEEATPKKPFDYAMLALAKAIDIETGNKNGTTLVEAAKDWPAGQVALMRWVNAFGWENIKLGKSDSLFMNLLSKPDAMNYMNKQKEFNDIYNATTNPMKYFGGGEETGSKKVLNDNLAEIEECPELKTILKKYPDILGSTDEYKKEKDSDSDELTKKVLALPKENQQKIVNAVQKQAAEQKANNNATNTTK